MGPRSRSARRRAQWDEARRLFDEMDHGKTLTHSMYLTIMKLLDKWDELTPIERKVLGHGNHTRLPEGAVLCAEGG